jgi:hypothetical protein
MYIKYCGIAEGIFFSEGWGIMLNVGDPISKFQIPISKDPIYEISNFTIIVNFEK